MAKLQLIYNTRKVFIILIHLASIATKSAYLFRFCWGSIEFQDNCVNTRIKYVKYVISYTFMVYLEVNV